MDRARFSGDGEGEERSAMRRIRSRPPGVLARASWGDRGGHCGGGPAPDPWIMSVGFPDVGILDEQTYFEPCWLASSVDYHRTITGVWLFTT